VQKDMAVENVAEMTEIFNTFFSDIKRIKMTRKRTLKKLFI
jgi:hypothetical protein